MNWSTAKLRASRRALALSYGYARGDLVRARKRAHAGPSHIVTHEEAEEIKRLERKVNDLKALLDRRDRQLAERADVAPRIITAAQLGLQFQNVFGPLGAPNRCAGHYTGGPRASNATELIATGRTVHRIHLQQGWGGGSYTFLIADDGTLLCLNPINRKAAHVAGQNSGNVGICCPATTGDEPTKAQQATLRWVLANAHTRRMPKAYRSPVDLRTLTLKPHNQFPGNATACPGKFVNLYTSKGTRR